MRLTDLDDGGMSGVTVDGVEMVVARCGDTVHAFAAHCPHAGAPLAEGAICDGRLICPWHKATFRLDDGTVLEPPALDCLTRYPVEIRDGTVLISSAPVAPPPPASREHARLVLVLGGGAAGTAAVVSLRDGGYTGRVVLLGEEDVLEPYDRTVLSKFVLAGEMAPRDVPPLRPPDFWKRYDVERIEATITRLDARARAVHLSDGSEWNYDRAILATGAIPRRLTLPGATLRGVSVLRSRLDAGAIMAVARPDARVVIVGSSFIGLEAASALRKYGLRVSVVAPETVPFEKQFGATIGAKLRQSHEQNGVIFHTPAKPARFLGHEQVEAVELEDGTRLPAAFVLLATGVRPATDFVEGVEKAEDGGVLVDEHMCAAPGLYAAGDCATFPLHGEPVRIEHWRVAQQHGRIGAENIVGRPARFDSVPFFWTYHYGKTIEYLGHAAAWNDRDMELIGDLDRQAFIALLVREGSVAAVVASEHQRATAMLVERMRDPLSIEEAHRIIAAAR